jgi:hypothetical protein
LLVPQVEELLSEEARETTSVSELKQQLQELQFQVADASEVRQQHWPPGTEASGQLNCSTSSGRRVLLTT